MGGTMHSSDQDSCQYGASDAFHIKAGLQRFDQAMHTAQEGVEVPPEEMEVPIGEEVDLALLEGDEPEDLSYAAMFAHQLNIGKDSLQMPPQKAKDSLQWNSAPTADPIVQPPSAGQVHLRPFRHHCNGITPMLPPPASFATALSKPSLSFSHSAKFILQEASIPAQLLRVNCHANAGIHWAPCKGCFSSDET